MYIKWDENLTLYIVSSIVVRYFNNEHEQKKRQKPYNIIAQASTPDTHHNVDQIWMFHHCAMLVFL